METVPTNAPIRVRRLRAHNIKCFEEVDLDLVGDERSSAPPWTVVLGDNGSGKSTLLKCIALALSAASSNREFQALYETRRQSDWLRIGTGEGAIIVDVETGSGLGKVEIAVQKTSYGDEPEVVAVQGFEPDRLFLCGYGAKRRVFGQESRHGFRQRDSVATLFDPDAALQNPELALRRAASNSPLSEPDLLRRIDDILLLPEGSTKLGFDGIEVGGPWGTYLPTGALSDGYLSTLAWILDMVGSALLRSSEWGLYPFTDDLAGIVLIDEIEQHLHPSWQRRIIGRLRDQFPRIQFVVSTHSPLCVIGTTDLDDSEVGLAHLQWEEDAVTATTGLRPPRGQRADQVLTSYLFGLDTASDDETHGQINRLSRLLSSQKLEPREERELRSLQTTLDEKLGSDETSLGRKTDREVHTAIDTVFLQSMSQLKGKLDDSGVEGMEVRRRLRELTNMSGYFDDKPTDS